MTEQSKQWIYVCDPMCSWCYAFRPAFDELINRYPYPIKLIMGGLAPDNDQPMPEAMRTQIASYWHTIEAKTGVTFNHAFWESNTPYRSTYLACRAVIAAGQLSTRANPNAQLDMVKAIQDGYYQQAKNPSLEPMLVECAQTIGLDKEAFTQSIRSDEVEKRLMDDINATRQLGIRGFPSLLLQSGDQISVITQGYCPIDQLLAMTLQIDV